MKTNTSKKQNSVAYFATFGTTATEHVIVICEEGVSGYRPVNSYGPYGDEKHARAVAKNLNDRLGLSEKEAMRIVGTTMGRHPPRRRGQS